MLSMPSRLPRALYGFAALLALALYAFALPSLAQLAEGRNYVRLKNPVPVETGSKIEVI